MTVSLVVAVSVVVAACGGGDDKLSKADLAKKANAICKKTGAEGRKIPAPANLAQDPVAAAAYFSKIVPIGQKEVDQLSDLKPADDVKDDWNQFLAREKQAEETLKTIRDKAEAKDQTGLTDIARGTRISKKLDAEAAAVGATSCGSG